MNAMLERLVEEGQCFQETWNDYTSPPIFRLMVMSSGSDVSDIRVLKISEMIQEVAGVAFLTKKAWLVVRTCVLNDAAGKAAQHATHSSWNHAWSDELLVGQETIAHETLESIPQFEENSGQFIRDSITRVTSGLLLLSERRPSAAQMLASEWAQHSNIPTLERLG